MWDIYQEKLEKYEALLEQWELQQEQEAQQRENDTLPLRVEYVHDMTANGTLFRPKDTLQATVVNSKVLMEVVDNEMDYSVLQMDLRCTDPKPFIPGTLRHQWKTF